MACVSLTAVWLSIQHGPSIDGEERMDFKVQWVPARTGWSRGDPQARKRFALDCHLRDREARGQFEEGFSCWKAMCNWGMLQFKFSLLIFFSFLLFSCLFLSDLVVVCNSQNVVLV